MKKIITMVMALVLTLGLAVPAFAATGITAKEQKLYDSFAAVVDKWFGFNQKSLERGNQFKSVAYRALMVKDLDKAACDDLQACVDRVAAFIAEKNPQSASDLKKISFDVANIVDETASKYGFKVTLNNDRWSDVQIVWNGKWMSVDKIKIVQTGYDLTATVVVAAMLVAAVGACFVVVGKKGLVVSPAE